MSATELPTRSQYLSFSVAGAEYAIPILQVREILQFENITRVPSVPSSIRGVINLRGSVVPVVDLALKFGLGETRVTGRTCILVVEPALDGEQTAVGVLADAVSEVLELGPGEIQEPPPFGSGVRVDFLVGMGNLGKGFVLLLDLDRVIAADEKELAACLRADPESATALPDEPLAPGPAAESPARP